MTYSRNIVTIMAKVFNNVVTKYLTLTFIMLVLREHLMTQNNQTNKQALRNFFGNIKAKYFRFVVEYLI